MGTKVYCKKCNDIIESKYRHDFQECKCGNIYVDGGDDYLRMGGAGIEDNSFEILGVGYKYDQDRDYDGSYDK